MIIKQVHGTRTLIKSIILFVNPIKLKKKNAKLCGMIKYQYLEIGTCEYFLHALFSTVLRL